MGSNKKKTDNLWLSNPKDLIPSTNPSVGPNSVYDRNGGIIVRTIVHLDPDSDLFMKVAQRAYQDHERSLVPCSKCGRKFFPDRIEMHERNCAAKKLGETKSEHQVRTLKAKPSSFTSSSTGSSFNPNEKTRVHKNSPSDNRVRPQWK